MFNLFAKKCPVCGMKVDESTGFKKNGKLFCSEDCALKFDKERGQEKKKEIHGCC